MRTTFARQTAPRRGQNSWWGKAWQRAVEEAAYSESELRPARASARRGDVGAISIDAGSILAAVREGDDAWTVEVAVPTLEERERRALVDVVAAESGRIADLLTGNLAHDFVEHAEEVGVELLPYGAELASTCNCDHYLDPCRHAVAVLVQTGWLVDADPLVLFAIRGLDRGDLLAELHAQRGGSAGQRSGSSANDLADDVELVVDAALRAQQMVSAFEAGEDLPETS